MKFHLYRQQDEMDCGPTCLQMIGKYYGVELSIQKLRNLCFANKGGVSLLALNDAATRLGFTASGTRLSLEELQRIDHPCILHWGQNHFVVLYKVFKGEFYIANPASGKIKYTEDAFIKKWYSHEEVSTGIALILSPTDNLKLSNEFIKIKVSWASILKYFYTYRQLFAQLCLGLLVGTFLSLLTPFLTQAIVDIGINTRDLNFVYLILIAQVMLFAGSTSVNFIRSWILLHISTRINLSILTDFLIKIMRLPMSFFETKTTGDIMQRMADQRTIETFLTGTTLSTLFSIVNLVVFTIALLYYNSVVFLISVSFSVVYGLWIALFLNRRRELNYAQFDNSSSNQSNVVELINGMRDIKLNNCEDQKRWSWERIQANLFKFKIQALALNQKQQGGSAFINQAKNILITFLSVKAVIAGQITLGGMMAIQYIVGQINSPVDQILSFIQSYQDAKISLERLNEIHELSDEEPVDKNLLKHLPDDKSIIIRNLTFTYPGIDNTPSLKKLNLIIPEGKITAIVGMSGSGGEFADIDHLISAQTDHRSRGKVTT